MERIVYNKTLDTHKSGVQFTLQGFETADKMSRRIIISLMANGDTIDLPLGQMEAVMYVTSPNGTEPSINSCTIKGNTIIYDVLPITEEGIATMQLKLIEASPDGTPTVLATPRFAVEVIKSDTDDEGIKDSVNYSAVEEAIARAKAVYEKRLLRIALHSDCMFYAYYADGTIYESDVLKELFLKGDVLLSQSYAKGGSGVRDGEETDNAMYYCKTAKNASAEAQSLKEDTQELLKEARLHGVYTSFSVDFETGEVEYVSPHYSFKINTENGDLEAEGEAYTFEDNIRAIVNDWLAHNNVEITNLLNISDTHTKEIEDLKTTAEGHGNDIAKLNQGLSDITKEMLNGILTQYNKSAQSCVRDKYGAITYETDSYLISKRLELTTIGINNTNTVTDIVDTEYMLKLDAAQPELIIRLKSDETEEGVSGLYNPTSQNGTVYVYDSNGGKLLGSSFFGVNGMNNQTHATITITDEEILTYIYENSPTLRFEMQTGKHTQGSETVAKWYIINFKIEVDKAKHFTYELPELTGGGTDD